MAPRVLLAALVAMALSASPAGAVAPPPLELIGGEGGLQVATSITVSPDGAHAYATAADSNAVVVFARDATTGDLTFLSCVNEDGTGGCANGKGLAGARSAVVSPNGAHVYVSSGDSDAVAVFTRNSSTGALTQSSTTSGCISETGSSGQCLNGRALDDAATMIISPDGANLYVGAAILGDDTVAVLNRNSSTGAISQASDATGCIS
jgi:DNA-binding beta-propeller fold protein YncE